MLVTPTVQRTTATQRVNFYLTTAKLPTSAKGSLYHSTYLDTALKILHQDVILGITEHLARPGIASKNQNSVGTLKGVSLTRSPGFVGVNLNQQSTLFSGWRGDGVVFELSWDKLAHNSRLIEIDYQAGHKHNRRTEAEEFLLGDIKPLSKYLLSVYASQNTIDYCLKQHQENPDYGYDLLLTHPKLKILPKSL